MKGRPSRTGSGPGVFDALPATLGEHGLLSGEEPGLAVPFGLQPVVGRAERLIVGEARLATVGHRVDVVLLQVIPAAATGSGADVAVEPGRCPEIEGGPQNGRIAAPEVGD